MNFMLVMIPQVIKALSSIHSFGYCHGDLKTANICARITSTNKLKFTLIDFGVSVRIPKPGQDTSHKAFRGNKAFASIEHITSHRARAIDDIRSLFNVAYKFVFESLPWEDMYRGIIEGDSSLEADEVYLSVRMDCEKQFDTEMRQASKELQKLFLQIERYQQEEQDSSKIDYDELALLLPKA